MPIDLKQIPPKAPPLSRGPSVVVLTIAFMVLVLFGVAVAFFAWPRTRPTGSSTFWLTVLVAPTLAALVFALIPYWWHAGKLRKMTCRNEVREQRKADLFSHASRPLAVLASSFYISPAPEENDINAIASGKLVLAARPLPDRTRTARARWLNAPMFEEGQDAATYDENRQRVVVQEAFRQLLEDLTPVLKNFPRSVPLRVNIGVSAMPSTGDCEAWWKEEWAKRGFISSRLQVTRGNVSVMRLDDWLDKSGRERDFASLTVVVQLQALLSEAPPHQSAEAAVALLLAPDELAQGYGLRRIACLHRPNAGTLSSVGHTLKYACTWGGTTTAEIGHLWQTGFNEDSGKVLADEVRDATAARRSESHSTSLHDLDLCAGNGGTARIWLALACAAQYVPWARTPQLVVGLDGDAVEMVVVRRPDFS
ncbi:hypothetical protein LFL97_10480 [Burkholderia sp. JSH-S8]|nr:hypothetical protein LFL97_10480 [Burkholderia sp. JSH-S8]